MCSSDLWSLGRVHRVERDLVGLAVGRDDVTCPAVLEDPHVRGTTIVVDDLDVVSAILEPDTQPEGQIGGMQALAIDLFGQGRGQRRISLLQPGRGLFKPV